MHSNSSLLKNNFYHAASGAVVRGGASTGDSQDGRRDHLLSAQTRATPYEVSNDKRSSVVSQSLACVNLKNPAKRLAPPKAMHKKERIFSAITAKTNHIKTYGTFDPTNEMRDESGNIAIQTMEPWYGVTDGYIDNCYSRPRFRNQMFRGFKPPRGRKLNRASTQKNTTSSPGSPAIVGPKVPQHIPFMQGHHIITNSLDSQPGNQDLYSPQNQAQTLSSAYFQNSQLMEMI